MRMIRERGKIVMRLRALFWESERVIWLAAASTALEVIEDFT